MRGHECAVEGLCGEGVRQAALPVGLGNAFLVVPSWLTGFFVLVFSFWLVDGTWCLLILALGNVDRR